MAELADAIVQSGRETLEGAIRMVNSHPGWRAQVVYGDTGGRGGWACTRVQQGSHRQRVKREAGARGAECCCLACPVCGLSLPRLAAPAGPPARGPSHLADSLFVLLPGRSREDAFRIGAEIAAAVTAANPPPVVLKMEKVGEKGRELIPWCGPPPTIQVCCPAGESSGSLSECLGGMAVRVAGHRCLFLALSRQKQPSPEPPP